MRKSGGADVVAIHLPTKPLFTRSKTAMKGNFTYKKDVYYGTFVAIAFAIACGSAGWWHFHRMPHGEQPLKDFIFNVHR